MHIHSQAVIEVTVIQMPHIPMTFPIGDKVRFNIGPKHIHLSPVYNTKTSKAQAQEPKRQVLMVAAQHK